MAIKSQRPFAIAPSAARTATTNFADQVNSWARGVRVTIDATAAAATPSVVFTIQGKTQQGDYYTLLASAAVTGTGNTELVVHPSVAAVANAAAKNALGYQWRVIATAGDADSLTYSIYAEYLS